MFKLGKCVLILYICTVYFSFADESDVSQTKLQQKVQELEKENKRLQSDLSTFKDQMGALKSQHRDEIRHLNDNLEQAKISIQQYTDKVAQQEKQLSSLVINQEVQKQERAKLEEFTAAKIQSLQQELVQVQSSADCPIIPAFITNQYNKSLQPYVDTAMKHEYTQKVVSAYYEHVHPVVQPVSEKVVNEYVPIAMNYSVWAGQKSYEFGVVVINSPQAKQAKEFTLKTDKELQKFILSQMQGIEQVKQYATTEAAMLIVYSMYCTILMISLFIFMSVCCRSKKQQPVKPVKQQKPQVAASHQKSEPKSKEHASQSSSDTTAKSGKKKSNGAKKGKKP